MVICFAVIVQFDSNICIPFITASYHTGEKNTIFLTFKIFIFESWSELFQVLMQGPFTAKGRRDYL